jgi:MFS family permease
MRKWAPLAVLGLAQFLMVLDQAVMNVSISQLVEDFDTSVTVIQGVITMYSLVMAMFMITGGKIGDIIGRRKAFTIGMAIYACGSALTAVSWSVVSLAIGWSVLEGLGAALVLPALVALIAGNYEGKDRITAYAIIGGIAGAGIAVGPIVGGWATTTLSWRVVFVGEVVIALIIIATVRFIVDIKPLYKPHLDWVGSILSALGLGMIVYGFLQASTWGWVVPKNSPIEPLGFSLTPFMVAGGIGVLRIFRWWETVRVRNNEDPLVKMELLKIPQLRSGLSTFAAQNLILMGVFFTIPLYLQLVVGLDALETGIRMLPISIAMFITSTSGSLLAARWSARGIVRTGLVFIVVAIFVLIGTIEPELDGLRFSAAMALLGVGMGLLASQLGNVVQSAVGPADRSEAGGLQWTSQQLGSALGVAIIGSIVLTGLTNNFISNIADDESVSDGVKTELSVNVSDGLQFVSTEQLEEGLSQTDADETTNAAVLNAYSDAQLRSLKVGLLAAAMMAAAALLVTGNLPSEVYKPDDEEEDDDEVAEAAPT